MRKRSFVQQQVVSPPANGVTQSGVGFLNGQERPAVFAKMIRMQLHNLPVISRFDLLRSGVSIDAQNEIIILGHDGSPQGVQTF